MSTPSPPSTGALERQRAVNRALELRVAGSQEQQLRAALEQSQEEVRKLKESAFVTAQRTAADALAALLHVEVCKHFGLDIKVTTKESILQTVNVDSLVKWGVQFLKEQGELGELVPVNDPFEDAKAVTTALCGKSCVPGSP